MTFISGSVHLSQSEILRPGLTETEFRLGNEGSKTVTYVSNPPYNSYKLGRRSVADREFVIVASFASGILTGVALSRPIQAGESWDRYDPETELAWVDATRSWVERMLNHSLPARLSWGTLDCSFDPRSGSGQLMLSYNVNRLA